MYDHVKPYMWSLKSELVNNMDTFSDQCITTSPAHQNPARSQNFILETYFIIPFLNLIPIRSNITSTNLLYTSLEARFFLILIFAYFFKAKSSPKTLKNIDIMLKVAI